MQNPMRTGHGGDFVCIVPCYLYKTNQIGNLKRHGASIHNLNVNWFPCTIPGEDEMGGRDRGSTWIAATAMRLPPA